MNPSRFDRWPRPPSVRHVWVYGMTRSDPPRQGLVLEWKRRERRWMARVVWSVDDPSSDVDQPVVVAWVPHHLLGAVRSDPNDYGPHRGGR